MKNVLTRLRFTNMRIKIYRYQGVSIAILPFMAIQYYKYKGLTSIGCIKYNLNCGWLIFGIQIYTTHK